LISLDPWYYWVYLRVLGTLAGTSEK